MPAKAPANRKTVISHRGLAMPEASAATSASRMATRARPNRLAAMLAVIQVASAARAEAEIIETPARIERPGEHRTRRADAAAGHALPCKGDLGDDGGKAQRRYGEVEVAQAERRQADDAAKHRAAEAACGERQIGIPGRSYGPGSQHGCCVGAHRQQRHPADCDLASEAYDQVEAGHQDPVDAGALGDHADIRVIEQRQAGSCCGERQPRQGDLEPGLPAGTCHLGRYRRIGHRHQTRRVVDTPARPSGLTSRMAMKTTKTATAAKMPPSRKFAACWKRPSARPPNTAPRFDPMPPSATGMKP